MMLLGPLSRRRFPQGAAAGSLLLVQLAQATEFDDPFCFPG